MDDTRPAGFWIRAIAAMIDFAVLFLVEVSYGVFANLVAGVQPSESWMFAPLFGGMTLLFAAAYTSVLHAAYGQTIGKLLTRIRVVALDGEPPSLGPAILRFLAYFLSLATLGIGFLMAGLRQDKRALHDLCAGTRVERLPSWTRASTPPSADAPTAQPVAVSTDQVSPPIG